MFKTLFSGRSHLVYAGAIVGIGFGMTLFVVHFLYQDAKFQDQSRFELLIRASMELLETRVEKYEAGLGLLQQFFDNKNITEAEWQLRLQRFDPQVNYSALIEVGYARYHGNYPWPPEKSDPSPTGKMNASSRDKRWMTVLHSYRSSGWPSIEYGAELYPEDWKSGVVGSSIKADNLRVTKKKSLKQDFTSSEISAITMYLPLFEPGLFHSRVSLPETGFHERATLREAHFKGLVFATIDFNKLIISTFGTNQLPVEFEIFSSYEPAPAAWLNDSTGLMRFQSPSHKPYLSQIKKMRWYGETWSLYFYTTPAFDALSPRYRPWLAAIGGCVVTCLFCGIALLQARGRMRAEHLTTSLRGSEARLQAALKNREEVSRNLHDGAIQSLYAIGLGLSRLHRQLEKSPHQSHLASSLIELDHVVTELRSYLSELDPGISPNQSPNNALRDIAERLRTTSGVKIHFLGDKPISCPWPPAAILDLLQAAREGVSNALRHGKATEIHLDLRQEESKAVTFTIQDNGNGFDPSILTSSGRGLTNLRTRAKAWQGDVSIQSRIGGPTKLVFTVNPSHDWANS